MLMVSGDDMRKYIVVKQKQLYTGERNLMFKGLAFFSNIEDVLHLSYTEMDTESSVIVEAYPDELRVHRKGEVVTHLQFQQGRQTDGSVLSEFGTIDIGIFTHKYIRKENCIAIEYDILSGGEVTDGYRILWIIKEDTM